MSYIKSENTYAYPNGSGGVYIHTNTVCDQASADIGSRVKGGRCYRYLLTVGESDFRQLVRAVLTRTAPEWVKPTMIEEAVKRFMAGEKVV